MDRVNYDDFITNAEQIMKTDYPATPFIVKNMIPGQGLVILAGPAKAGKSLLITQLLVAVTGNNATFLGLEVSSKKGEALYLALEDTESRLKERFIKQKLTPNERFKIALTWTVDEQAIKDLDEYLSLHPEIILVIVDTKAKICSVEGTQMSYQSDYNFVGLIKKCADKHGVCIILVTHLRKRPSDDVFNEVNGTSAIMGAADTIIILKRPRNQNRGILSLTSRDFQEREEEIFLNYETLTWHSQGENSFAVPGMTPERQQIVTALKELGGEATPKAIGEKIGKNNKLISNSLKEMARCGFVKKSTEKHGVWVLPSAEGEKTIDSNDSEEDYVIE